MPGKFNPLATTLGGEELTHYEELAYAAIMEAGGTALSQDDDSYRAAEVEAEARCLAYLYYLRDRAKNQWTPALMTDFLPRWVKIYGIKKSGNEVKDRMAVARHLATWGIAPTLIVLEDFLATLLGGCFVGIVLTSPQDALASVPGGASNPAPPDGVTYPDGDWRSSVAHLAIETTKNGLDDNSFYSLVGQVHDGLQRIAPAWVTYDWFLDGPLGAGFYLDSPANLDNQRFD
jgi:hypothetical protein